MCAVTVVNGGDAVSRNLQRLADAFTFEAGDGD